MGDDTSNLTCPDCGADMSLNGDDEMECDGPDCTAHLDRMVFDDDDDDAVDSDDDDADDDKDALEHYIPDDIQNDPRPREDRDVPWSDMSER